MTAPETAPALTASVMMAVTPSKLRRATSGRAIGSHHRGREGDEAPRIGVELDLYAKRQGEILDIGLDDGVTGGQAERDGIGRVRERTAHDVDGARAVQRAACLHGAEDDAGDTIEAAGLPELGEAAGHARQA